MFTNDLRNPFTQGRQCLIPALFGLKVNGPGMVAGMYMYMATGQGPGPVRFGFAVIGRKRPAAGVGARGIGGSSVCSWRLAVLCMLAGSWRLQDNMQITYYIRSGASIPNNFNPLLITFPVAYESWSRNCLDGSSSALRIDNSW